MIDAGHGGYDVGAVSNYGDYEKDINLDIALLVGKQLKDLKYEPLFPYFAYMREERNAFRVLNDTFVTSDSGTGVVHQAPYFGEVTIF